MPEFSCADFTFPLLDRMQTLQLIRLLGFDYVDVGLFARSATFRPMDLCAAPQAFAAAMKTDLAASGLRIADLFLQVGEHPAESAVNDPDATVRVNAREVFLRTIELCKELNGSHITGLPGTPHEDASRDFDLAVEESAWRVQQCEGAGVRYSVEPHVGSICGNIAATLDLLDAVRGLTLTLDYGHFVYQGTPSAEIHPLLPYASHIHVRGGAKGRLQTSTSENQIDFAGMASRLIQLDYKRFLTLEYVWVDWENCNRTDNVSETILLRQELDAMLQQARNEEAHV